MKIMDYLKEDWVMADLQGTDKLSVLKELSRILVKPCQVPSEEELLQVLLDREKLAIHRDRRGDCHSPWPTEEIERVLFLPLAVRFKGIDFDSIDHKPTHLFFLVMAPENSAVNNLKLLSRIVDPPERPFL